jgi:hypothetical protein
MMLRHLALGALFCAVTTLAAAQQTPPTTTDTLRPEVATPARAGIDLLKAGQFKEALAKVAEAEAVPNRTPYENFVLDQLRAGAAAGLGDTATAMKSYEAALATGRMPQADALGIIEGLAGSAYKLKDWDRSIAWSRRYFENGGTNPQMRRVLANALVQKGDNAGAAKELTKLIGDEEAGGRRPGEDLLRLLLASQTRANDAAGSQQALEKLLRLYPKPLYWRERIAQLQRDPAFDSALLADSYRLLFAAGAFEEGAEYKALAELALRASQPGEAKSVLEAGAAASKLPADAAPLRERAAREAAADLKDFVANPKPAATATANALVANGIAQATSGRAEQGIALVEQGIAKGGLTKPELARLRLGWLLAQEGRNDAAKKVFGELQGSAGGVGELARLWMIRLDRPAGA